MEAQSEADDVVFPDGGVGKGRRTGSSQRGRKEMKKREWVGGGKRDKPGVLCARLVREISPLYAFCSFEPEGKLVLGGASGLVEYSDMNRPISEAAS